MLSRLGAFKFQYRVVMEPIIKWSLFFVALCIISMADFKERSWESFASRRKGTDRWLFKKGCQLLHMLRAGFQWVVMPRAARQWLLKFNTGSLRFEFFRVRVSCHKCSGMTSKQLRDRHNRGWDLLGQSNLRSGKSSPNTTKVHSVCCSLVSLFAGILSLNICVQRNIFCFYHIYNFINPNWVIRVRIGELGFPFFALPFNQQLHLHHKHPTTTKATYQ